MADPFARRAHAILRRLIEMDDSLRDAEAVRACEGDGELLLRVRRLVGALERTRGFLEAPVGAALRAATLGEDRVTAPPTIPGFRIERLLGAGGMAAVYEATQDWPKRRVALKIMRRGVAGATALKRFEFETEVLARLRHPGIAQLHEAGTFDDGAGAIPFFAMEFVDGARPITAYCEEEGLDLRERLEMMAQVCDAVQHGHQNGVIHRDLKPGNVLVDSRGMARVIDFGIARSTVEDEVASRATTAGQIIGTLGAMSPEQCTPKSNVDARTDVYSLGVLLYELACRRPPHDLAHLPIPEALRVIHDVAPTRPSAIDPRLRGDVEAIILKAMDKAPARRYPTVAALGADLRRYLEHQTVEARPPTLLYQLRLFARRHRAFVTGGAVAVAALVVATGVSAWSAFRAHDELVQRRHAEAIARGERDAALRQTYVANVAAALSALQFGLYAQMQQYLDEAPAEQRGWEWRWLNGFADSSASRIDAHDAMIFGMALSADGERIATVAKDGTVQVRRLPDLALESESVPHASQVNDVAFLPDGERLLTASHDGNVAVVRASDGTVERTIGGLDGGLRSVSARDATTFATASRSGRGHVWDLETGTRVHSLADQAGSLGGVRFGASGRALVTWTTGGNVWIRDGSTFGRRHELVFHGEVACVSVREDLDRIAVGGVDGRAALWRLSDGAAIETLAMPDTVSLVRALAFSGDGSLLAVGQGNGAISVVEAHPGGRQVAAFGHTDAISGLAFSADCGILISSSWDRTLRVWDMTAPAFEVATLLAGHDGEVTCMSFAPSGAGEARLASGGSDGTVRVWDTDSNEELLVIDAHDREVNDVAFSPDGAMIASASDDRTVRLWRADTGEPLDELRGHGGSVWAIDFSPDGRTLASCGNDRTIRLWDLDARGAARTLKGHAERVISVRFSRDGTRLASTSRDWTARIWSVATGETERELVGHESDVFAVTWSADDSILYTGGRDHTVRVWSTETGAALDTLEGARQFVTSLSLSPDGTRLAAGTWYGSVTLFDPRHGDPVASFRLAPGILRDVAFSADGARLAITSGDGAIRVLDAGGRRSATPVR